jgi:hypothetical protein
MFKNFIKLLLLFTLSFSHFLYADEAIVEIHINDVTENESAGTMTFTISLSEAPIFPVSIDFSTLNGSALAGSDYIAKSDYLLFALGVSSRTFTIDLVNDADYEPTQKFYIDLSTSSSGYVSKYDGIGTITDDDIQSFELDRFNDKGVTETDNDQVIYMVAYFNQNTPAPLTLTYHTQDNSALAGSDYIGITDTIKISAGVDRVLIPVTIKGDYTPEVTKNFKVIINSISTGTITDNSATTTIHDDDTIKVNVDCSDINESNSGESNNIECKIFLDNHNKPYPAGEPDFTVDYTSQNGSSHTAMAGDDYTTVSGFVTFTEGDLEHIVNIPTIGDNEIEHDENVRLVLSGSSFIIGAGYSEAEIINDDGEYPGMGFGSNMNTTDFYVVEGNSSQRNLNFTFTLDAPAVAGASFDYYTEDVDTNESNDYVPVSTTYNIPEGDRNVTVSIKVNGDTDIEYNEIFNLRITNEQHLRVYGHTAKGHIINDDGSFPTLSCTNSVESIIEGDSGQKTLTYFFSLDKPIKSETSFDYDTWDDDEDDKDADSDDDKDSDGDDDDDNDNDNEDGDDQDYEIIPKTHYNIENNETEISIEVTINSDIKIESDEIFYLSLYNFTKNLNVDSSCRSIETTIVNDDGNLSEFSIEAPTLVFDEKDSNQTRVDFTIKLDAPAKQDGLSIEYLTIDGTAQEDDFDFDLIIPTTITFDTGEQNKTFSVYINGDTNIEPDESFFVKLQNPHNATLASRPNNQIEITITNDDAHSDEPFTCDNSMYLSSSIKRGTGETGKMWLHKIDTTHNPFAFNVVDDEGETKLYNALAYSDSGDENITNYIFGLYKKELLRLSRTGKVISLGNIDGLPDILSTKQLFAGAIYDGYYYISGPGQDYDKIFKIKLSDKTVTEITLDKAISLLDFSFTPNGKFLHGIIDGGELVKIDVSTGIVTNIGSAHTGYQFDSTFSDKNGRFFANDSKGNGFFEFDLTTGEKLFLSASQQASFNDGANCLKEALVFNDYGDAPIGYGQPRHTIANGIFMGNEVDHDINPFDTIDADGDDNNGVDDEDGITFVDGTDINGSYFDVNGTQELNIMVSKDAYLNAWLDFGIDGSFATAGDQIITAKALTAGTHTINFNIPENVVKNKLTYIRLRYSSTENLDFEENAVDGEVEDYVVQFGSAFQPLRGVFNIERTNSGSFPINTDARHAWYTQIVGRDFDYSIIFYEEDMSAEKIISNLTAKVELVDTESNTTLYERYFHFPSNSTESRFNISHIEHTAYDDDLSEQSHASLPSIPASKDVRFRISYEEDSDGNIIQTDCVGFTESDYKNCYNNLPSTHFQPTKDDFAIRPDYFHMIIYDGSSSRRVNTATDNNTSLRVSAGYDYNLSVTASTYNGNDATPAIGYTTNSVDRTLEFLDKSNSACPIKDDYNSTDNFIDGKNTNNLMEIKEVGEYKLNIIDNKWTEIDSINGDCDINKSTHSNSGNIKSGCNIVSPDINLSSYPDHFVLNLAIQNLPNSTHNGFIYMSEMNSTFNKVAIAYQGSIVAQNEDNETTQNFTNGYFAQNVTLELNATTISNRGVNTALETSDGSTVVNFARTIEFNNDGNITRELNSKLSNLSIINITSDKFTKEHNGTANIDIRYNINKNLSKTINPIQITFHNFDSKSINSNSISHGKETPPYIPTGNLNLGDSIRNFYFARVVSDLNSYPAINMNISPIVRTPLNVDIFCKTTINNYCADRKIMNNTNLTGTTREQIGWYLSAKHNHTVDGNVTNLQATPNIVTIIPNPINPITLTNGENGLVTETFINCSSPQSIIKITTSPALSFEPSQYVVNCSDKNASQWTGIGSTGNILKVRPKVNQTGKMNW